MEGMMKSFFDRLSYQVKIFSNEPKQQDHIQIKSHIRIISSPYTIEYIEYC